jgi:hypothetical protein
MSTEDGLKVHVCVTFDIAHEALEGMLVACDTREPMHESVRLWLYFVADNVSLLAQSTVQVYVRRRAIFLHDYTHKKYRTPQVDRASQGSGHLRI